MKAGTWVCDACDTNNSADSDRCRRCKRVAGSTTATDVRLADGGPTVTPGSGMGSSSSPLSAGRSATPAPGGVSHDGSRGRGPTSSTDGTSRSSRVRGGPSGRSETGATPIGSRTWSSPAIKEVPPRRPAPPRSPLTPPPLTPERRATTERRRPADVTARPPLGYGASGGGPSLTPSGETRPTSRTGSRLIKGLVLILLVVVAWYWGPTIVGGLQAGSSSAAAASSCPARVAVSLPGGEGGSVLVAAYETDRFLITVCKIGSGQLYYDGQIKAVTSSADTHITLEAESTTRGFIARNEAYIYEIRDQRIIVKLNGDVLLDEPLRVQDKPT